MAATQRLMLVARMYILILYRELTVLRGLSVDYYIEYVFRYASDRDRWVGGRETEDCLWMLVVLWAVYFPLRMRKGSLAECLNLAAVPSQVQICQPSRLFSEQIHRHGRTVPSVDGIRDSYRVAFSPDKQADRTSRFSSTLMANVDRRMVTWVLAQLK